jgi:RimJ/RimL family protein N-acetyltransferase
MDIDKVDAIVDCIFAIYSSPEIMRYEKDIMINERNNAMSLFMSILKAAENGGVTHYIKDKKTSEYVGLFTFIGGKESKVIIDRYNKLIGGQLLTDEIFIQYFLKKEYWGKEVMYNILKHSIIQLVEDFNKTKFCAIVNKENKNSIRLLEKLHFNNVGEWDIDNYLYHLSIS